MNNFKALIPVLFFLLISISACQSSKDISKEETYSPCTDKLFLELQKRDSTTYTDFEKDYLQKKSAECIKYGDKTEHDKKQKTGEKFVLGIAIAGGVLLAVLLYFGLAGGGH